MVQMIRSPRSDLLRDHCRIERHIVFSACRIPRVGWWSWGNRVAVGVRRHAAGDVAIACGSRVRYLSRTVSGRTSHVRGSCTPGRTGNLGIAVGSIRRRPELVTPPVYVDYRQAPAPAEGFIDRFGRPGGNKQGFVERTADPGIQPGMADHAPSQDRWWWGRARRGAPICGGDFRALLRLRTPGPALFAMPALPRR